MQQMSWIRRGVAVAGALALMWSCAESPPTSSLEVDDAPALAKPSLWSARSFIKTVSLDAYSASGSKAIVDVEGGSVSVSFPLNPDADGATLASARFKIPAGALGNAGQVYLISMTANAGDELDDIDIQFGPAGTTFNPEASLRLVLYGEVSAEDIKEASHIYADGRVESVETTASDRGPLTVVVITVPGFSRYGFDDDDSMAEESVW